MVDLSGFGDPDDPANVAAVLLGGPISGRRDFAVTASPTHRVHRDAPPFLIQHGTDDTVVPYVSTGELPSPDELAQLVSRDAMIGVAQVAGPASARPICRRK